MDEPQRAKTSDPVRRTPVTVLTGFLGSGKTTLLSRWLQDPAAGPIAVIVNEIGAVGLDHLILESVAEDTVLLEGGCVCCAVRSDLVSTLQGLVERRASGAIPEFERIVLETSGLADPAPILLTLHSDPVVLRHCYADAVLTVVSAVEGLSQLPAYGECAKQAALADCLVISKTDLVDTVTLERLRRLLPGYNPGAPVLETGLGMPDAQILLRAASCAPGRGGRADLARWLPETARRPAAGHPHTTGIRTFCVISEVPLTRPVLGLWLSDLTRDHGARLLRVKGIVALADAAGPVLVHAVQHRLYPPVPLAQWPSGDHRTRIVFVVTGGLDEVEVMARLDATARALGPAPDPARGAAVTSGG